MKSSEPVVSAYLQISVPAMLKQGGLTMIRKSSTGFDARAADQIRTQRRGPRDPCLPRFPKRNLQCLIPGCWIIPRHLIREEISNTKKSSPPAVGRAAEYVLREHSAAEASWGVEPLIDSIEGGLVKRASTGPLISRFSPLNYTSSKRIAARK